MTAFIWSAGKNCTGLQWMNLAEAKERWLDLVQGVAEADRDAFLEFVSASAAKKEHAEDRERNVEARKKLRRIAKGLRQKVSGRG